MFGLQLFCTYNQEGIHPRCCFWGPYGNLPLCSHDIMNNKRRSHSFSPLKFSPNPHSMQLERKLVLKSQAVPWMGQILDERALHCLRMKTARVFWTGTKEVTLEVAFVSSEVTKTEAGEWHRCKTTRPCIRLPCLPPPRPPATCINSAKTDYEVKLY